MQGVNSQLYNYKTGNFKKYMYKAFAKKIAKWTSAYRWKGLKKTNLIKLSKQPRVPLFGTKA